MNEWGYPGGVATRWVRKWKCAMVVSYCGASPNVVDRCANIVFRFV